MIANVSARFLFPPLSAPLFPLPTTSPTPPPLPPLSLSFNPSLVVIISFHGGGRRRSVNTNRETMAKPRLPHFDQHPSAFLLISTMRSWLPVSILLPSFVLEEVAASFWWSRAVPLLLSALHPQRAILPTTCTSAHYLQQSLSRTRQRRPTPRRRLLPTAFVVVEQESHAPTFEAILLPLETSQAARPTSQHAFDSNVSCI